MHKTNLNATSQALDALAAQLEKINNAARLEEVCNDLQQMWMQWNSTEWADDTSDRRSFQFTTALLIELLETIPTERNSFDEFIINLKSSNETEIQKRPVDYVQRRD